MLWFQIVFWDYSSCLINFHHLEKLTCGLSGGSKGAYVPLDRLGLVRGAGCLVRSSCSHARCLWRLHSGTYPGECLTGCGLVFLRGVWRVMLFSIFDTLAVRLFLECLPPFSLLYLSLLLFKELPLSPLFSLLALDFLWVQISGFLSGFWDSPLINFSYGLLKSIWIWLFYHSSLFSFWRLGFFKR